MTGKKILIIEDDDGARDLERNILEREGYEILEARDAKTGIGIAIDVVPDAVLMDIRLPNKKRGIGAARILRDNEKTSNIPIIFVTGYNFGLQTSEVRNIPNCGYVTKPFAIKTLLDEVRRFLS